MSHALTSSPRNRGKASGASQPFQQRVVFVVRTDPIPNHRVSLSNADGAPAQADAHGKYRKRRVDAFELEAWMLRVVSPDAIGFQRALLNLLRKFGMQLPKRLSRA